MLSTIAAVRFGYGADQGNDLPALTQQLVGDDTVVQDYPNMTLQSTADIIKIRISLKKQADKGDTEAKQGYQDLNKFLVDHVRNSKRNIVMRAVVSDAGFRERLVQFWTNHFTVVAKNLMLSSTIPAFIDDAIRPHIAGNFSNLLTASTLHPVMLNFLDQTSSIGPNSNFGKRKGRGLNENLARELLELHTMGVNANYTQADVRQLAELLTGLSVHDRHEMQFSPRLAEPGTEQVLGQTYGGDPAKLTDIQGFLVDASHHRDTAQNIAQKLVVHFVSDDPNPDHVAHVANRFYLSGGDLMQTYIALLEHPNSTSSLGQKAKQPFDYVVSGIRALGYTAPMLDKLTAAQFRRNVTIPMSLMGQNMFNADGPDGWPENADAWITPIGLAGRLQWAMQVTEPRTKQIDPRKFLKNTLGDRASNALKFAVLKADNKQEAMAMVLASPAFNRR